MNKIYHRIPYAVALMVMVSLHLSAVGQKLIINEVHGNPASGDAGDANGDGTRSAWQDEFIEFVNNSTDTLNISNWTISTGGTSTPTVRHTFPADPATILPPGGVIVLFGGGDPTGEFGGSIVQTCNGTIGSSNGLVANSGATIEIRDPYDNLVYDPALVTGSFSGITTSFTRTPDITGPDTDLTEGTQHPEYPTDGDTYFSPGVMLDGTRFIENTTVTFAATTGTVLENAGTYTLLVYVINTTDATEDVTFDIELQDSGDGDIGTYTVSQTVETGTYVLAVDIPIEDDSDEEDDEDYIFEITNVSGGISAAVGTNSTHTLTVEDDETSIPYIELAATEATAAEGDGSYALELTISQAPDVDVYATVALADMTGSTDDVGSYTTIQVTFPAGSTDSQYVTIDITDDDDGEEDETFTFDLTVTSDATEAAAGSNTEFVLTIAANDLPIISFPSEEEVTVEAVGTYSLYVQVENPGDEDVTAVIALTDAGTGTAADLDGFTQATVTFPAGETSYQEVDITVTDDDTYEEDETFVFEIQDISGGLSGTVTTFTLTIENDDDLPATLTINEVLPWPAESSADVTVDANGDGIYGGYSDEMIELVNSTDDELDIGGWQVGDASVRYTFDDGLTLKAGEAVVIFGGWSSSAGDAPSRINESRMFLSDGSSLGLLNSGDQVNVWDDEDNLIDHFEYDDPASGMSLTRNPDITGDFSVHPALNGVYVSPGMKVDGTAFIELTTTEVNFEDTEASMYEDDTEGVLLGITITRYSEDNPTYVEVTTSSDDITISPSTVEFDDDATQYITITTTDNDDIEGDKYYTITLTNVSGGEEAEIGDNESISFMVYDDDVPMIFNEVLVDPASGTGGDANNDGTRSASEDQFVELVNVYDSDDDGEVETIDISNWELRLDDNTLVHKFLAGTTIDPYEAIVVFGGGVPIGTFGGSQYQISSEGGLSLDTSEGRIILQDEDGVLQSAFQYGSEAEVAQSLTRSPDITGYLTAHASAEDAGGTLFSPGTKVDGSFFGETVTAVEEEEVTNPVTFAPNPVQTSATITVPTANVPFDYQIINLRGQLVLQGNNVESETLVLDFSALPAGIYLYRIVDRQQGTYISIDKFIVVK